MRKLISSVVCAGLLSVAATGNAAPVTGSFTFVGSEDVQVGFGSVNFGEFPEIFNTPIGDIEYLTGVGTFVGIGGSMGEIRDIVGIPVNTPTVLANFLKVTFTSDAPGAPVSPFASLNFTMTQLAGGVFSSAQCFAPPAPGQTCTPVVPGGSPFNLVNDSASSFGVTMRVLGFVTNAAGERSRFTGNFSSQRTDIPYQAALGAIADDEIGFFRSSYSADFAFTPEQRQVPEPANMALMGLVLSGAAFALRRRKA